VRIIRYYIIRDEMVYHESGGDHYERKNPEGMAERLTQRLGRIGRQTLCDLIIRLRSPACGCADRLDSATGEISTNG